MRSDVTFGPQGANVLRTVLGNVRHLHRLRVANVFLLDGGRGDVWMIDTGHALERPTLLFELRSAGIRPSEITGVLLTHRHSDHAGNAAFLRRRYGIRIYAHRADAAVLAGEAPRPRLPPAPGDPLAGLFAAIENRFPAAPVVVDRALDDGDAIAGLEVHWVPGHTEGSVFYRHESTGALLTGDTLLTAHPPLTIRAGLCLPYPSYAADLGRAHAAIRAFHDKAFSYEHLLAGHGPPLLGGARRHVLEMLERELSAARS